MKKVIFIAFDLNPELGSEATKAYNWLRILSNHFKMHVFTQEMHRRYLKENFMNVKFTFVSTNLNLRNFLGRLGLHNVANHFFIKKVKELLNQQMKDSYLLIHCITPSGIHSYNDLYKLGIPVLVGPLGGGLRAPKGFQRAFKSQMTKNLLRNVFYAVLMKWNRRWKDYFRNSKKVLIGTNYMKDFFSREVSDKCEIFFDTFVDTEFFKPAAEKPECILSRILFVGRFESHKGVTLLLDAAKKCVERGVGNFTIEFVGDGSLRRNMQSFVNKDQTLANIIKIADWQPKQQLLEKYISSDIFCFPTLREPGGNSVLEAMACGLPVITSDYGGPKYSVGDGCGIKIRVLNYNDYLEELVIAIIKLINDKQLCAKMGIKAREHVVNNFSFEATSKRILRIYREMIE